MLGLEFPEMELALTGPDDRLGRQGSKRGEDEHV